MSSIIYKLRTRLIFWIWKITIIIIKTIYSLSSNNKIKRGNCCFTFTYIKFSSDICCVKKFMSGPPIISSGGTMIVVSYFHVRCIRKKQRICFLICFSSMKNKSKIYWIFKMHTSFMIKSFYNLTT